MRKQKWIAIATLAVAAFAVPVTYSVAQGPGPGQGGQHPSQGGQFPPSPMPTMQMMPGGGGATMLADGDFLYILQGNRLFKVDKRDLGVRATGTLPMQQHERVGPPPPEEAAE